MRSLLAKEHFFSELSIFPYWLEMTMEQVRRDRNFQANHFRHQIEFVGKDVHIYRYEEGLDNIVKKVNEVTGLELSLPSQRLLDTQHVNVSIQWTSEAVSTVNQFYADDFKAFDYKLNEVEFISA
jgi:hypothetical protein